MQKDAKPVNLDAAHTEHRHTIQDSSCSQYRALAAANVFVALLDCEEQQFIPENDSVLHIAKQEAEYLFGVVLGSV